jgi:3-oxoadipate enol-lactonase
MADTKEFAMASKSRVSSRHEEAAAVSFFKTGDGVKIAYTVDGAEDRPALVLSNSIGTNFRMWDDQIGQFAQYFRVVRYDFRGHGASDVPAGAYSEARLGRDVLELLDWLELERAHFLGLSLGGIVGQWLGVHAPARIDRLILSNTAAYLGPPERWNEAIAAVLAAPDMKATAEAFIGNWFPNAMVAEGGTIVQRFREMLLNTPQQGLAGCWAAVRDMDMRRTAALIPNPTLVIAGQFDTVTSLDQGRELASIIPQARLKIFPAVHLSNVECPAEFAEVVLEFLRPGPA